MATFLTTSKMNPALAKRIERSIGGTRGTDGKRRDKSSLNRRIIAMLRVAMVLTVVFGIYTYIQFRRHEQRELEQARADLLSKVTAEGASLSASDKNAVPRAETWLERMTTPDYAGDLVSDELRASPGQDALKNTLATPLIYVRGPLDGFKGSTHIAETARGSTKDALLVCMIDPPAARTEKVLLDKVRIAYLGGSPLEAATVDARRLHDAINGLPYLLPQWADRVKSAADRAEVLQLRTDLDHAGIERTKQAAKAGLFLIALDEPGDGTGPTELDGERSHFIRIALIDLASSKILLRKRIHVDPSFISLAKRPTYASGLDGCAFAYDVHESLGKK